MSSIEDCGDDDDDWKSSGGEKDGDQFVDWEEML